MHEGPPPGRPAVTALSQLDARQLLDQLPVAAVLCEHDGRIAYWNVPARRLWGRDPEPEDTIEFCRPRRSVPGEQAGQAPDPQANGLKAGERSYVERPGGERIHVRIQTQRLRDAAGADSGWLHLLLEANDRRDTEDARQAQLLAAIVASSNDAIVSKSLDGIIQSWNPAAEQLFGYTAEEVIGRPIYLIVPPERRGEEEDILARLRRGERIEHFETVRVSKEGRPIEVELSISPVHDAVTGQIVGASKLAHSVAERNRARQALVAVKNELAAQLEDLGRLQEMSVRLFSTHEIQPIVEEILGTAARIAGTDMGWLALCDEEGNGLELAASLGLGPEALAIAREAPETTPSARCARERRRIVVTDVASDVTVEAFRGTALRAGFRSIHSTPLMTRGGRLLGVLTLFFREPHRPSSWEVRIADLCARQAVDFIENARLYALLRDADRSKNEFLAMLAHELRHPLAPIRNAVRIVHLVPPGSHEAATAFEIIERQVMHLNRLIEDLFDIASITANKLELRFQPVDLSEIVRLALETSRPHVDARGVRLTIEEPTEPCLVDGDPTRLAQVISNLLINAAKFTTSPGEIRLVTAQEGGEAVIRIRDTGIGISPEALPKIFDLFMQGERRDTRTSVGLGIGLSLVKRLVQMHGGAVVARSEGLGKGSEFEVRLPALTRPSREGDRRRAL